MINSFLSKIPANAGKTIAGILSFLLAIGKESFSAPRDHLWVSFLWHSENMATYFFRVNERILL